MRHFAETNSLTVAQAAGYLVYRHYWNVDRKLAILGSELFQGKTSPSLVSEVDPLKCLWLTARNNISKARYVNMRLALLKHVKLAPYSFLRELRMAITPQLHTWPLNCAPEEQRGVYAELGEAIRIVVQRMIQFGSGEFWVKNAILMESEWIFGRWGRPPPLPPRLSPLCALIK